MRRAASLLELIVAIVIMGISVMSLPMILTQTQENNALARQQAAILATKEKINFISLYKWDENSFDTTSQTFYVLDTTGTGDASFDTATNRRVGHVLQNTRRKLKDLGAADRQPDNEITASPNENDIDDFNNKVENTSIASEDLDYVISLELNSTVDYIGDSLVSGSYNDNNITFDFNASNTISSANPTNIKMVKVNALDSGSNGNFINTTLYSFSSNIGSSSLAKRAW